MALANPTPALNLQASQDRSATWLPLLRSLTRAVPTWGVWKNFGSAFKPGGDVDSVAPRAQWPTIEREWVRWAQANQLGPVIVCPHVPYLLHLFALHPSESHFFELDVNCRKLFLGSTLFTPPDILPLMRRDENGVRRLRPGAEGVFKLVMNGSKRGGRPDWIGMQRKNVRKLLASDPKGAAAAAQLFGVAESALKRGVAGALGGDWNRTAMFSVEARSLLLGMLEPWNIAKRLWFRVAIQRCPVLRRVFEHGRTVPADTQRWLAEVRRNHRVIG